MITFLLFNFRTKTFLTYKLPQSKMPSDAKKKREQKKKEAAKRGKKGAPEANGNETNGDAKEVTNGADSNGGITRLERRMIQDYCLHSCCNTFLSLQSSINDDMLLCTLSWHVVAQCTCLVAMVTVWRHKVQRAI